MRKIKKVLTVFSLGVLVQLGAFYFFDPLGYPDTMRYFCLADFLGSFRVNHTGDLGYNNGIIFTQLFLPYFVLFFNKITTLPYVVGGVVLQFICFQATLLLSYGIALKADCEKTARLTVILLLTHLAFCSGSVLILTEYPFMAVLLSVIYYLVNTGKIKLKQAFILSFLLGALISIRTQGIVPAGVIGLYLLFSGRMRLKMLPMLLLFPAGYCLFYFSFYLYLAGAFPLTITLKEAITFNDFLLAGGEFADYDFSLHGIRMLVVEKTLIDFLVSDPAAYIRLVFERFSGIIKYFIARRAYFYLFPTVIIISFFTAKIKEKVFMFSLMVVNLLALIFFLTPYHSFIRYQAGFFPLAIIFVASCFVHIRGENLIKGVFARRARVALLAGVIAIYLISFAAYHNYFFLAISRGKPIDGVHSRQIAINSAQAIREEIGTENKIPSSHPYRYGVIRRSGNIPLCFYGHWKKEAILDYIRVHNIRYFLIEKHGLLTLRQKGIAVRAIRTIPGPICFVEHPVLCKVDT